MNEVPIMIEISEELGTRLMREAAERGITFHALILELLSEAMGLDHE